MTDVNESKFIKISDINERQVTKTYELVGHKLCDFLNIPLDKPKTYHPWADRLSTGMLALGYTPKDIAKAFSFVSTTASKYMQGPTNSLLWSAMFETEEELGLRKPRSVKAVAASEAKARHIKENPRES